METGKGFNALTGLTLEDIEIDKNNQQISIRASGKKFFMNHVQDCCEEVKIESIQGDISKAIGELIIDATEHSNSEDPRLCDYDESWT